jgi:hypothetical protein
LSAFAIEQAYGRTLSDSLDASSGTRILLYIDLLPGLGPAAANFLYLTSTSISSVVERTGKQKFCDHQRDDNQHKNKHLERSIV